MLMFDHLEEAIGKAAFLKELCFGVRIVRLEDGETLFSSACDDCKDGAAIQERVEQTKPAVQRGRNALSDTDQSAYSVTRVPIRIAGENCTLEMIQPRGRVLSAVSGASGAGFNAEQYLSGAVGNMVYKDTLTGLYNRRYIDEFLPAALNAAYEQEQSLSLIFADIDQFKRVNDSYGHLAGDLALQHVAQLIEKKVRKADRWVARYGGDEFIICLPGVDYATAVRIANRIRVAIMSERFPLENSALNLTCSFGVQSVEKHDFQLSARMLLHRADEKLYQAKHSGRNVVI